MLHCWFHLNDVHGFLCVLLKKHHGGGVRVDVELLQQPSALFVGLVYIAKAHKISEGKRRKLECRINSEARIFTTCVMHVKSVRRVLGGVLNQFVTHVWVLLHRHVNTAYFVEEGGDRRLVEDDNAGLVF